ncbi:hypothetical protein EGW08_002195 [Elysia chlorotica]|uniref:HTH La-type RNA-binding domain-containing protein n=1 Tax=Elysia chlorotica TaxID=188477 RepID=A0A433U876_ELYCH|nr:hypothetical protein EGW08_002195 [Elysia chlorotica]
MILFLFLIFVLLPYAFVRSDSHVCCKRIKTMAEEGDKVIPEAALEESKVPDVKSEIEPKTETPDPEPSKDGDALVRNGDAPKTEGNGESADTKNEKKEIVIDENLKAKIVKQIEYYFGDLNLSKDRFLKEQVQLDDGWVASDRMMKFNRLNSICSDWDVIAEALRESSQLMEVSEDGKKIRRSPSKPLPGDSKERRDAVTSRTVYANRFPLDANLDELMLFFESFGPVENIFMKRDFHKHTFKGSVFTTFTNKEDAEKFLNDKGTTFVDTKLEVKQWKTEERQKKPSKVEQRQKEKREEKLSKDKKKKERKKVRQQMTRGAVLHISGMSQETDREEVRRVFLQHGDVSWIDFNKGVTEGYVRLKEPNSAVRTLESLEKMEGGIVLNGTAVHVRVVEGEEEFQYWQKMFRDIADRKLIKKEGFGKNRQHHKNRRGRGGKRGRGNDRYNRGYDGPPAKVARTDD